MSWNGHPLFDAETESSLKVDSGANVRQVLQRAFPVKKFSSSAVFKTSTRDRGYYIWFAVDGGDCFAKVMWEDTGKGGR